MRANYKVPNRVKRRMAEELYMYWDNVQKIKEMELDIIDGSPIRDETGIRPENLISKPTETKAIKIADSMGTRALIMAKIRIGYIESALKRLSKDELEIVQYIFRDKYSQIRAETDKYISLDTYYNVKNKIIYLVALEFGEI